MYTYMSTCTHLPSLSSSVIDLDTTSLEARSLAVGAYLSMNLSPALLSRYPPSPLDPSVIRHPAPYIPGECTCVAHSIHLIITIHFENDVHVQVTCTCMCTCMGKNIETEKVMANTHFKCFTVYLQGIRTSCIHFVCSSVAFTCNL